MCQRSIFLSLFFRHSYQCFKRSPLAVIPSWHPPGKRGEEQILYPEVMLMFPEILLWGHTSRSPGSKISWKHLEMLFLPKRSPRMLEVGQGGVCTHQIPSPRPGR